MRLADTYHIATLTLEELVDELVDAREKLKAAEAAVYYVERAVIEAMDDKGATVVQTDAGKATLTAPVTYDYSILAKLREITSPPDLIGYTPERDVVKHEAERWNMTQAKALAKLSHEHRAIIEDAKIPGQPRVQFKARPQIKGGH